MAQHAHVPKFGNWDSDGNVPYTQYFDDACKGRGAGKLINPNDAHENPVASSKDLPPVRDPPFRTGSDLEASKSKEEWQASREDVDIRKYTESSLGRDAIASRPASNSPHHRSGDRAADPHKRASRISNVADRSTEQSPLHPHYQVKTASKGGVSSPSWERKGSSEGGHGLAPNTSGKSRMRPSGRGDETPERGAAVPKFGEWDENNPSSADGFTRIFNQVREEKQTGSAKGRVISNDSAYTNGYNQSGTSESTSCFCFGWCKKQ